MFRGKAPSKGWLYGSLINDFGVPAIRFTEGVKVDACLVNKQTVGQYTGFTDKNGAKVFEHDQVKAGHWHTLYTVIFSEGAFLLTSILGDMLMCDSPCFEIIGNIHKGDK